MNFPQKSAYINIRFNLIKQHFFMKIYDLTRGTLPPPLKNVKRQAFRQEMTIFAK